MFKSNKANLLISIICAIALWVYIVSFVNPDTEHSIDGITVDIMNIEALYDRGLIVANGSLYDVSITVRGSRSEVLQLEPTDFHATVDVTGYPRGTAKVSVNVVTPNDIELVQVRPETIDIEIVDRVTVFKPVRLEFAGEFTDGQEPGFIEITPNEMEVSGIAEDVDSVDYIRAIMSTDILTGDISTSRIAVVAIGEDGDPVYNVGLSQNSVEVTASLCVTKTVPFHVEIAGQPIENIEVTDISYPNNITIRGSEAAIESITEIDGGTIDLSTITSTEEFFIDSYLTMPEGIEVANASKDLSVRIEVQGISNKEFEFNGDSIVIENLPANISAYVNTNSVTATVLAPQEVLAQITQDDIRLFIDATDRWRGESTLELEVSAECSIEVNGIRVEPERVRVSIIRSS